MNIDFKFLRRLIDFRLNEVNSDQQLGLLLRVKMRLEMWKKIEAGDIAALVWLCEQDGDLND